MRQTLQRPFGAPAPSSTIEDFYTALNQQIADAIGRSSQIRVAGGVPGCNGAVVVSAGYGSDCHSSATSGKRYLVASPVPGTTVVLGPATGRSQVGNEGYGSGTAPGAPVVIDTVDVNIVASLRCVDKVPIVADTRLHEWFNKQIDSVTAPAGSSTVAPYTWQSIQGCALKIDGTDIILWTIDTGGNVFVFAYDWTYGSGGTAFCPTLTHDKQTLVLLQPREIDETGTPVQNHISTLHDVSALSPAADYWVYETVAGEYAYWSQGQEWGDTTAAFCGDSLAVVTARPTITDVGDPVEKHPANPTAIRVQVFQPPYSGLDVELDPELTIPSGLAGVALPIAGSPDGRYLILGISEDVSGTSRIRSYAVWETPFVSMDTPVGVRDLGALGYELLNANAFAYDTASGEAHLFMALSKIADGTAWLGVLGPDGGGGYADPLTAPIELIELHASTGEVDYMTITELGGRVYLSSSAIVQLVMAPFTSTEATVISYAQPSTSMPGVFLADLVYQGPLTVTWTSAAPYLSGLERRRELTVTWTYTGPDILLDAILVLPLPAWLTYVSGSAGATYEPTPRKVTWSLGDLDPSDTGSETVIVSF